MAVAVDYFAATELQENTSRLGRDDWSSDYFGALEEAPSPQAKGPIHPHPVPVPVPLLYPLGGSRHHRFLPQVPNRASLAFQFDRQDVVKRDSILLEPSGERLAVVCFEDADGFSLAKVEETAVTPDVQFVLKGVGNLADIPKAHFPHRERVAANEFVHSHPFVVWAVSHFHQKNCRADHSDVYADKGTGREREQMRGTLAGTLWHSASTSSWKENQKGKILGGDEEGGLPARWIILQQHNCRKIIPGCTGTVILPVRSSDYFRAIGYAPSPLAAKVLLRIIG